MFWRWLDGGLGISRVVCLFWMLGIVTFVVWVVCLVVFVLVMLVL